MMKYVTINIESLHEKILFEIDIKQTVYNKKVFPLAVLKRLISEISERNKETILVKNTHNPIFDEDILRLEFPLTNVEREYFVIDDENAECIMEFENDTDALLFFEINK